MNFLSHYYFDKDTNPYQILGSVLPDLFKNATKIRLHPEKNPSAFLANPKVSKILMGWNNHLAVDKYFHNSTFFFENTARIKIDIKPMLEESLFRPSFLAHITLELILDHLLLTQQIVHVDAFYTALQNVEEEVIEEFLTISGVIDSRDFMRFFTSFMKSRYLFKYEQTASISYALNQICMRVWPEQLDDNQLLVLTHVVSNYSDDLSGEYLNIFKEIHSLLPHIQPSI